MNAKQWLWAAGLSACAWGAQALQITHFSPQGEVARVRQVVAKFDAAAVNFGDPKAPAPITLACSDANATQGTGRWTGEREWVFDFRADLPPGVRCTATVRPGFKSASGAELAGAKSYQFNSGGPFVQSIRPGTYQRIDEEQFFVLQLNGAATTASVQANVWCTADGVGERIPVRMVEGAQRAEILKALGLDKGAAQEPLRYATLTCNRRLTSGTRMQLVFGKGVATESGVPNTVEKRFDYQVREPFAAEFSCERENAQAACLPIRPMQLSFNAPVPRKLALAIPSRPMRWPTACSSPRPWPRTPPSRWSCPRTSRTPRAAHCAMPTAFRSRSPRAACRRWPSSRRRRSASSSASPKAPPPTSRRRCCPSRCATWRPRCACRACSPSRAR